MYRKNIIFALIPFFLPLLLCPDVWAQIQNGSFEDAGGNPNLSTWTEVCTGAEAVADAPPGGGNWSLKKEAGHAKGCMPGLLYQTLPDAQNGEIWQLTAWAKRDGDYPMGVAGIFFFTFDPANPPQYFSNVYAERFDTTYATQWQFLSVVDTLQIPSGETAAVALHTGLAGGPSTGYCYFDLVNAQNITEPTGIAEQAETDALNLFPNPTANELWLTHNFAQNEAPELEIYDVTGGLVWRTTLRGDEANGRKMTIDVGDMSCGTYCLLIKTKGKALRKSFVIAR